MQSSDHSADNSIEHLIDNSAGDSIDRLIEHSIDKHRHCFLLKGATDAVLSDFLQLSRHLSTPLICAYDVSAYDAFQSSSNNTQLSFTTRNFKHVRQELGSTHDAVLVDLTQGVSASALAILSGTVRGNGLFAIALPEGDWLAVTDQDLARYLPWPYEPEQVESYFKHYLMSQLHNEASPFTPYNRTAPKALPALVPIHQHSPLTTEQARAQSRVIENSAEAYVLIAPRGRGKSTLLGDTIAKLMMMGKRVAVTAPNQDAIATLTSRFLQTYQDIPLDQVSLDQALPFFAPDALLANKSHWDYLFVDEAAMIPVPLLMDLNKKAKHCVFSTTDYGYEGAGKGFGIRFCGYLEQLNTPLEYLSLQQPIRWGGNDPLEHWINDCFILGETTQEISLQIGSKKTSHEHSDASSTYQQIIGKEWLKNTHLLVKTFNLLVSAHYQTSADNIRWIMDDPSVSTFLSLERNAVKSVAVVTEEGLLPTALSDAVMQGTRRPRGHLVPQSLLAHEGIIDAGEYRYWRISRIATDPISQRQGTASQLLKEIELAAQKQGVDFLSTSFAATVDVVSFWLKNGFIPVRLGTAKDQASGCYSMMMVKPIKQDTAKLAMTWHQYYLANLKLNLHRDYQDLDDLLAKKLSAQASTKHRMREEDLIQKDKKDLELFINHHRPYPTVKAQITRLMASVTARKKAFSTCQHFPLLHAVTHQANADTDFTAFGLMTKKQVEKQLRKAVQALLENA